MASQVIQSVWPILVLLAYLLVKSVITVFLAERRKVLDVHDRVRRCMELRQKYLATSEAKPEE